MSESIPSKLPKTFNRPQVIALYALAMLLGNDCEFTVLTSYTVGSVLVEARSAGGLAQYMLPTTGGYEWVAPKEAS